MLDHRPEGAEDLGISPLGAQSEQRNKRALLQKSLKNTTMNNSTIENRSVGKE